MASRSVRTWRAVSIAGSALALVAGTIGILQTTASARPTGPARAADPAVACAAGTTVTNGDGPVCGIVSGGVAQWFGIPYAAPPVGALRWQPPQPPDGVDHDAAGDAFGSECTQQFRGGSPGGSEDCLFVNVWAPRGRDRRGIRCWCISTAAGSSSATAMATTPAGHDRPRGRGVDELPAGDLRVPGRQGPRRELRRLRAAGSAGGAALGPEQRRQVRRRPAQCDHLRRVGRRIERV